MAYVLPVLGGLSKQEITELLPTLIKEDKLGEIVLRRMIGQARGVACVSS